MTSASQAHPAELATTSEGAEVNIPLSTLLGYGLTNEEFAPWINEVIDKSIRQFSSRLLQLMEEGVSTGDAIDILRAEGNAHGLTPDYGDTFADAFLQACWQLMQRSECND